jgi:3-methyladenine DNA glycosylase/8-oxoguanine DNA glycosylase
MGMRHTARAKIVRDCPSRSIPLSPRAELELEVRPPFHFVGTMLKPSHFPSRDGSFDGERHRRTLRLRGELVGVELRDAGSPRRPRIHLTVHGRRRLEEALVAAIRDELVFRLDLRADLAAFERECGRDRLLAPALERWRGMRVSSSYSLYELLVVTTVLQNTTVRRSVQMLDALFRRLGRRASVAGEALESFWPPGDLDALDEAELRALRLGYRARILKRQAAALAGDPGLEDRLRALPTPELRAKLLGLYGVGPASVGTLCFEQFKRYGDMEHVSPWEQRIFSRLMFGRELVSARTILREAERRWGRWKMLAAHYLFEDLFWRHRVRPIPWLAGLIRL